MSENEILIAGAGHGGLVSAGFLADSGFDVTVFEKDEREEVSWDWKDCLDREVFSEVGIPEPDSDLYEVPENFRFYSPNEKSYLETDIPTEKREISMERRDLINHLVDFARSKGAKVCFENEIRGPVLEDGKIVGFDLGNESVLGEMMIDSAGFHTPVRRNLPESYDIVEELSEEDYFYTYRGYFEKTGDENFWDVYIGHNGRKGITWVNSSGELVDVLIGSVNPFESGEVKTILDGLSENYDLIGEELVRGGQVELIPIRRPLSKLVGDNFALVGDSGCMTNPINGSGIANSILAGKMLSDQIISIGDLEGGMSVNDLWPYQVKYNKEIGMDQGFIDVLKNFLISMEGMEKVDFLFENKVLTANDISKCLLRKDLDLGVMDILKRIYRGFPKLGVLKDLRDYLKVADEVKNLYLETPERFSQSSYEEWKSSVEEIFTEL